MNIQHCLQQSRELAATSDSARLDAELLLSHLLQKPRSFLYARPDHELDVSQTQAWQQLFARRLAGEPMAYILGVREFRNLLLQVTPAVLIPRPETELLVELALPRIPAQGRVLDLGTGSGAIALAIADERRDAQVTAIDASAAALAVAQSNGERLGLPVRFLHGEWFAPVPGEVFDVIASNPPYIDAADPHLQQGDVRAEPRSALVAARNGLADLETIASEARAHLRDGGFLLLEHGYDQGKAVAACLQQLGYSDVCTHADMAGHDRVTIACWRVSHVPA
ncbi:MAG: peptide chain release factor N(5)-glutamine methyltransferase [Gammaproteobacteria bacterium]|nr:MAG: peptide chain release factor N(5)-glutamine methyltransferase [Gammaproteobacteria bacterium]